MSAEKEKQAKLKALQLTLDKLDKTYGKGAVMKMGDSVVEEVEAISSGSLGLDLALGVGGYPRGRVIEIYGPESSGKTTLTLHAIAEAQKAGGIAAFIDAEHAFDKFYAENLGVDIDNLIIETPKSENDQVKDVVNTLVLSASTIDSPIKTPARLSFNDKDSILDMGTNKSTDVIVPKTIERLEKMNEMMGV